ncbi:hypothetical protein HUJ04_005049 [Dendroctonus ponderosae]|uniref:PH domain-containing protein n=1 Tax=Dendroctonus ponderosae TaxID=77166 RepID=A0AAR5PCM5_DENPD|nr:hypothetical protein HUJ04_005049 [Dendroctonus ponderosae]KAH1007869.1 hypothetical protein HUJ04_005049 [Dendroctonus ponderosae]
MTWFRWWHKHARIWFSPKSPEQATKWTKKLSAIYVFFAWNALGLLYFKYQSEGKKLQLTPEQRTGLSKGQQEALERGDQKAKIIRIDGFNISVLDPPVTKLETGLNKEALKN